MRNDKTIPLGLAALGSLALAQPTLSLLRGAPEFFAIRDSRPLDLWVLAMVLGVVAPALPVLAVLLTRRAGGLVHRLHLAVWLVLLVSSAAMPALSSTANSRLWLLAPLLSVVAAGLYDRFWGVRLFFAYLAPAILLVPLTFVLDSDVRRAVAGSRADVPLGTVRGDAPVVLVIFDEWTFSSILDADAAVEAGVDRIGAGEGLRIDAERLPNLAAFAATSNWYVNALGAGDTTELAIPALLTGRFPRRDRLPTLSDHPQNLFTRLGGTYDIHAVEPVTRLCPPGLNRIDSPRQPVERRLRALAEDVAIVWLRLLTPPPLHQRLPPITSQWSGFGDSGGLGDVEAAPEAAAITADRIIEIELRALDDSRPAGLRTLLAQMSSADRQLYVVHVMLPHFPFEYLPSGRRYLAPRHRIPGIAEDRWREDDWLTAQALQRYLLQVSFADRLIGELVARLHEVGIWDRALVILGADHGASFTPGRLRRLYAPDNVAEVAPVPFLIKFPGQQTGRQVTVQASTVDVLPTVLDVLGAAAPADSDGRSLSDEVTPRSPRFYSKIHGLVELDAGLLRQRLEPAARQSALFGKGIGGLYELAVRPELTGRSVHSLTSIPSAPIEVRLEDEALVESTTTAAPVGVDLLRGTLPGPRLPAGCCELAIAIDGRVVTTTRTYEDAAGSVAFQALLSERDAQRLDSLELFRIERPGRLEPLRWRRPEIAHLERNASGKPAAVIVDGQRLIVESAPMGFFDTTVRDDEMVRVRGWAFDRRASRSVDRVLLFLGDRLVASGAPTQPRPDVAAALGAGLAGAGFELAFPLHGSAAELLSQSGVQGFAVSGDRAAPIHFYFQRAEGRRDGRALVANNGRSVQLGADSVRGWIERVERREGKLLVSGWATDRSGADVERIVVLRDGRYLAEGRARATRRVVPSARGKRDRRSRFTLAFDAPAEASVTDGSVEIVAITSAGRGRVLPPLPRLVRQTRAPD